eukprot:UN03680
MPKKRIYKTKTTQLEQTLKIWKKSLTP